MFLPLEEWTLRENKKRIQHWTAIEYAFLNKNCMQKYDNSIYNSNGKICTFNETFSPSNVSVDSLKIRIPLSLVSITDSRLTDHCILVSKETGSVVDETEYKNNSLKINENGIKIRFAIEKIIVGHPKDTSDYLTIMVSSKCLKSHYFIGITIETISLVYEYLISKNVVWFSFQSFLNGECVDIDIKTDILPVMDVKEVINKLYYQAEKKRNQREGCSVYRKKTNLGIQFALRNTSSFKRSPYLKFYEKVRELNSRSKEFMDTFLNEIKLPSEILRIETTIKNKKHLRLLGQSCSKLGSVLENIDEISLVAFENAFQAHLKNFKLHNTMRVETNSKLSVNDKVLIKCLFLLIEEGYTYKEAVDEMVNETCSNKHERYYMRGKMKKLYSKGFEDLEMVSIEDEMNSFLRQN